MLCLCVCIADEVGDLGCHVSFRSELWQESTQVSRLLLMLMYVAVVGP